MSALGRSHHRARPWAKPAAALIAGGALFLAGCPQRVARPAPPRAATPTPAPAPLPRVGHFTGTLRCSDCTGVAINLILGADWKGTYRYQMTETHVGEGGARRTVESQGMWQRVRGTAIDPDAVVYQLNPDRLEALRNFAVLDEWRIRQLDRDGTALEPLPDYVLTRSDRRAGESEPDEPAATHR